MTDIKYKMISDYKNNNYKELIDKIHSYLNKGYAVDYDIVRFYIKTLIRIRYYDKAYELIKWLETYIDRYPSIANDILYLYFYCFKPKDAERILNKYHPSINIETMIRIYLLQGKVKEAEEIIDNYPLENKNTLYLKRMIYNHKNYNAYIETTYESFIENGNELEEGHIIYLKHKPTDSEEIDTDEKAANRPYMIWKIDKNKLYLFPVTTTRKPGLYILYYQKYPNSIGDRTIKDHSCTTTIDNVLSICDKVLPEDLRIILQDIYNRLYLRKDNKDRINNEEFMKQYHTNIDINSIILIVNQETHITKYYFVIDKKETYYRIIEVDESLNIISNQIELFNEDQLFHKPKRLTEEEINRIKKQIPPSLLTSSDDPITKKLLG